MKVRWFVILIIMMVILAGCQAAQISEPTAIPSSTPTQPLPTEEPVLTEATLKVPTEAASNTPFFSVTGLVENVLSFNSDDIKAMEVVKITAKHPKKDEMTDYEGVRLNTILDMASPKADAKKIVMIALDDYTSEVDINTIKACADCLISFNDEGNLKMIMPGMESAYWVKDVVKIEVQ